MVLDASVLIAQFEPADAHHAAAAAVLTENAAEDLGASPVTLAEVLVVPARLGDLPRAQALLARLGVETVALPEDAPARLALLRANTRLRLPDCCVLLAAEQSGGALATFDEGLAAAARARGLVVVGVG